MFTARFINCLLYTVYIYSKKSKQEMSEKKLNE